MSQNGQNNCTRAWWVPSPFQIICGSCNKYDSTKHIISLLVYFSKGQYLWFEFLVQNFRTSDYRFGGFYWKHEPDCFRMKLWFADSNLRIPDTSCSYWVDRWGGSNMMMNRSLARIQQNDVWCKHVSWEGNSIALFSLKLDNYFECYCRFAFKSLLSFVTHVNEIMPYLIVYSLNCTTNSHRFNTDENTGTCPHCLQAVACGSNAPLRIYLTTITFVHLSAKRNSCWDWNLLSRQCTCGCNVPAVANNSQRQSEVPQRTHPLTFCLLGVLPLLALTTAFDDFGRFFLIFRVFIEE